MQGGRTTEPREELREDDTRHIDRSEGFRRAGITVLFGKRQRAAQLETEKAFDKIEQ